jgi:hypothetical protein
MFFAFNSDMFFIFSEDSKGEFETGGSNSPPNIY